jgi:hypothetical protein
MRKPMHFLLVLAVTLSVVSMGSAQAQTAETVSIAPTAKLVGTYCALGRGGVVRSRPPGAGGAVSQDDQRVVGQTGIPVRCDGKSKVLSMSVRPLPPRSS